MADTRQLAEHVRFFAELGVSGVSRDPKWRRAAIANQRTTDHGPRITDDGPRTTHHGPRTTDHGPRTTDHGPRTTDYYAARREGCNREGVRPRRLRRSG